MLAQSGLVRDFGLFAKTVYTRAKNTVYTYALRSPEMSAELQTINVENARDLGYATAHVQKGKILRCACPVRATEENMCLLQDKFGITTMIDLRSEEEIKDFGQAPILAGANFVVHEREHSTSWFSRSPAKIVKKVSVMGGTAKHKPFTVHHLSMIDRKRFYWALVTRLPTSVIASGLVTRLWDSQASTDIFMNQVNLGGLNMLYEIVLETSAPEFGAALQEVKSALSKNEHLMVFCKAGKDRTGLLVMLLLHIAGATDDEIIADYIISDGHGKMALGDLEKREELNTLDRSVFSRAPREAMEHALNFLRKQYGSIDGYLAHCGFEAADQAELKALLARKE